MKKIAPVLSILALLFAGYKLYAAFFAKPYGDSIKAANGTVYFTDKMTKTDAEKTAAFLQRNGFYEDKRDKDLQLDRSGDTVLVRMVVEKEKITPEAEASFPDLTAILSDSLFGQKPVNLLLCNDEFETYRTVAFQKSEPPAPAPSAASLSEKQFNGSSLYYSKEVLTEEQVDKLGNYLVQSGFFGDTKLQAVVGKPNGRVALSYVVNPEALTPDYKTEVAKYAMEIKQAVFGGEPFEIRLCNDDLTQCESVPKAQ